MIIDNYKTRGEYIDDIDFWDIRDQQDIENESTDDNMNDVFFNNLISSQKFTKKIKEDLIFKDIKALMDIQDGNEAYIGAYSETEFFAYRYFKAHGVYPSLVSLKGVSSGKFIEELLTAVSVPPSAYYKSIYYSKDKMKLSSFVIGLIDSFSNEMYVYLDSDEAQIFYDNRNEKTNHRLHNIIGLIKNHVEPVTAKNKIFVVYQGKDGFEKIGFNIKKVDVDLKLNYNDDFPDVSDEIIKGLNDKDKSNLVMLSGSPGTGKTTYIRYLTSKLNKNIIFISPDMVNSITDPAFIPFLMENNNSILIIEDAEPALGSRTGSRSSAVSNILNLTDGLLSDCLNISIVATFNTSTNDIDEALLRKGRLLKNYKFDKLNATKSKLLLKSLGKKTDDVKGAMSLADIYFLDEDNNSEKLKHKKVGFGN